MARLSFPLPSDLRQDEIDAADALLSLALPFDRVTSSSGKARSESLHLPAAAAEFPRWGVKRKRSVPGDEKETVRLSPSTPLSFYPSGGDDTPLPLQPPPPAKKIDQHKEWVKEQNQMIAHLSASNVNLHQSVSEAKRRYEMLRERNSWLKNLQAEQLRAMRQAMIQQQQLFERNRSRGSGGFALDLFPVGPTRSEVGHHRQQRVMVDLRRERPMEWRRIQEEECRAARKRRIELQRVKFASSKIQRLR